MNMLNAKMLNRRNPNKTTTYKRLHDALPKILNYVLSSIFVIVKKMYTVCKNKYEYTLQEHHDHLNPF